MLLYTSDKELTKTRAKMAKLFVWQINADKMAKVTGYKQELLTGNRPARSSLL